MHVRTAFSSLCPHLTAWEETQEKRSDWDRWLHCQIRKIGFLKIYLFILIGGEVLSNIVVPFTIHQPASAMGIHPSWISSHLPPHPIPQGHPNAPALSTLSHASHLDWRFVSHFIIHMFQCHSPKSSHPCPLPQSPKVCSLSLCLFCCLAYRVIVTIFLNSIYMH